jgi:Kef-type K+ transport system membrane component KefB
MELNIIITICFLILLAYVFDITSAKTKIPSVILLLILGWMVKELSYFIGLELPNLEPALPVLGTIGLILIVLEGTLELPFDRSKLKILWKTSAMAILPMVLLSASLTLILQESLDLPWKTALINAIPLFIISSAIAIPSVQHLNVAQREFVTYESSISDIVGVIFFNFFVVNEVINSGSLLRFFGELGLMAFISFVATLVLALLLSKIRHKIKFIPIILLILMIYAIAKIYHLPALILIMVFGLFLGNIEKLNRVPWIQGLKPALLSKEVEKFREITGEATFLVRSLFFLLFGFLIDINALLSLSLLKWSALICLAIFLLRFLQIKLMRLEILPLLFIAPRGLITILLYLSIPAAYIIPYINKALIVQVIIISALVMSVGLLFVPDKLEGQHPSPAKPSPSEPLGKEATEDLA